MKHKKLLYIVTLLALGAGIVHAQSATSPSSPSLGDAARAARKNKADASPTTRHYDNDNLPLNDTLSVVGPEPVSASTLSNDKDDKNAVIAKDNSPKDNPKAENKDKKPADPATAAVDRQKAADEMKKKLADQQEKIDSLNHEINLDQREQHLREAAFYSDAGNRLRNSAQWEKDEAQSKNDSDSKQKALDAAKQQYEEMQEQARKAGIKQTEKDSGSSKDNNQQ